MAEGKIIRAGAVATALAAIIALTTWYFRQDFMDRPALASEVAEVDVRVAANEAQIHTQSKLNDQRLLYEVIEQIERAKQSGKTPPPYWIDEKHRLEQSIQMHDAEIHRALQRRRK
jgi:hypothetical protein